MLLPPAPSICLCKQPSCFETTVTCTHCATHLSWCLALITTHPTQCSQKPLTEATDPNNYVHRTNKMHPQDQHTRSPGPLPALAGFLLHTICRKFQQKRKGDKKEKETKKETKKSPNKYEDTNQCTPWGNVDTIHPMTPLQLKQLMIQSTLDPHHLHHGHCEH